MKIGKKRVGTKVRSRTLKKWEIAAFPALILLVLSAYFTYAYLTQSPRQDLIEPTLQFRPENPNAQLRATIVDQLSFTSPNQTFIEAAAAALTEAGYTVDYFSGEKATVEFFRNLPRYEYRIVVLRVHSTAASEQHLQVPVTIFTSERYSSSRYVNEQINDQLGGVAFSEDEKERGIVYFGICPQFITDCMIGRFPNTTIIMMGCQGLENTLMAKAFVEKGARVYVGWSQGVTTSHTDTATSHLLQHLFIEKQTLKKAVQETFKDVGIDPTYESLLLYYPLETGEQTIDSLNGQN